MDVSVASLELARQCREEKVMRRKVMPGCLRSNQFCGSQI